MFSISNSPQKRTKSWWENAHKDYIVYVYDFLVAVLLNLMMWLHHIWKMEIRYVSVPSACLASCDWIRGASPEELSSLVIHGGNTRRDDFEFLQQASSIVVESSISLERILKPDI